MKKLKIIAGLLALIFIGLSPGYGVNLLNLRAVTADDADASDTATCQLTQSSLISIEAKITAGATAPTAGSYIQVVVVCSKTSGLTGDFSTVLKGTPGGSDFKKHYLTCYLNLANNGTAYYVSEPFIAEGDYVYCWIKKRSLAQAITVTVDATERL